MMALMLERGRLVLTCAFMLSLTGGLAWFTMPRQEDPMLPNRFGLLVIPFPGADAERVERLLAIPLEEELAQVGDVRRLRSSARADVLVTQINLKDRVSGVGIEEAWDDVREAIEDARREFPAGVLEPELNTALMEEQETVLLAVTGSLDLGALHRAAERLKSRLLRVSGVSKVKLAGDPGEQVTVEFDDVASARLGMSPGALAGRLAARNQTIPGGAVRLNSRSVAVSPDSDFDSFEAIADTMVTLNSGAAVRLGDVAAVRFGPEEPTPSITRVNGKRAVALGIVAENPIDLVALGTDIRAEIEELRAELSPIQIVELSFQPDYVEARLTNLGSSLLLGIAIVAAVLMLTMGVRLGALVATIVPLVAFAALGLYAVGGGILHQISVAALVIALGMLVDNAIVVAESIQLRMDRGEGAMAASVAAVRELAIPLATATGTTLAAFVPMYASKGATGDFTRAIPLVIMLTLVVSYVFAVFVTPVFARLLLRPAPSAAKRDWSRAVGEWAGRVGVNRPNSVLAFALVVVTLSVVGAGWVEKSFFPAAGRDQMVVELVMPEGSHIDAVDEVSARVERHFLDLPDVVRVASFVGRSAPKFYYNLPNRPNSPHFSHLMLTLTDPSAVDTITREVRRYNRAVLPEAQLIPKRLEQGPPLAAPIELRLYGEDLHTLYLAAEDVMRALDEDPAATDVRQNLGLGRPTLTFAIDDAAAERRGVSRADVSTALFRQTRGIEIGQLRAYDDPIPIRIRAPSGENVAADRLDSLSVYSAQGTAVPVAQVAQVGVEWRPAVIHRRNGERHVPVLAELTGSEGYATVLARTLAAVADRPWQDSVRIELGGAAEGSGDANSAIATAAPIGGLLLLFFLLAEFNSFRRVAIILVTIPLAAAGVVPGLLIGDQPFGFMSLLGVIALIGVVVNNAIVLIDLIETRRGEGESIREALASAVAQRTRPILLTSLTTIAGLLPLALSSSPLWPPLASAMIAGLFASTFLTLLVVPALYTRLFREQPV